MPSQKTPLVLQLPGFETFGLAERTSKETNGRANKLETQDRAFHDWYRFVLSFPPHLVRQYLSDFGLAAGSLVLDPFCGTGTTLIEARLQGMAVVGLEANPFAHFASTVKLDWEVDADLLEARSFMAAQEARAILEKQGIQDEQILLSLPEGPLRSLDPEQTSLLLENSISPLPLHKVLTLLDALQVFQGERGYAHLRLALANALVFKISNLHFGPEVGVKNIKVDVPVISNWLAEVERMASDLRQVRDKSFPAASVFPADARQVSTRIAPHSVDAVITSPPYPNEKDYTRTTRLESVLLGLIHNKAELRALKQNLVRSNTRGVYKVDDDDQWVANHPEIQQIAEAIEQRRIALGKDSGFERMYSRVTKLYFGGMMRHLADLRTVLKPGAQLAYVVGDQASYLRVMIRTGQLLADLAQQLGYELVRIDLFRTRMATATREQLREEVVVLRWKGGPAE